MITRNFNLYLNAGHSVPLVINVNQYDSGEQWVFTLYNADGTQYIPSTGAIVGIKSDGLGIINSGSVVDGNVVINETQQMTAAVGKAVFELMIDSQTHGTANFVVLVEEKPGNNADLSESDLSLLQEAIDATSPLPTGGSVGQVLTKTANGSTWSDAGTPTQEQVADAVSEWADEHITVSTGVVIDTSLAVAGAAADSKKVGDEITDLKSAIQQIGGGLSAEVKQALMDAFNHVVWDDDDPSGQTYITALQTALYPPVDLVNISAVYTQSGIVYDTDSLDSLKTDLVVTAHYDDYSSETVTSYVLSGNLTVGTSTITVMYGGKTATFTVTVSSAPPSWLLGVGTNIANASATPAYQITNSHATNNVRATYMCEQGNVPSFKWIVDGDTSEDSGYYPIPIPSGAVGVRFSSSNSNVYAYASAVHYTGGAWISLSNTGYKNSSFAYYFDADATHWIMSIKNGSAGTAAVTQAMAETMTIEYIYDIQWDTVTFAHDGVSDEHAIAELSSMNLGRGDIVECSFQFDDLSAAVANENPLRFGTVTASNPANLWTYRNGYKYIYYLNKSGDEMAIDNLAIIYNSSATAEQLDTGFTGTEFVVRFDALGFMVNGKHYQNSNSYFTNIVNYLNSQATLYVGCHKASTAKINYLKVHKES